MSSATYIGTDSLTQGHWLTGRTKRGKSGYCFVSTVSYTLLPTYIDSMTISNGPVNSINAPTDAQLETPDNGPVAKATWLGNPNLTISITANDSAPHIVSLYIFQGNTARREDITVTDSGSTTLSVVHVTYDYTPGFWYSWLFTGSIQFVLTPTSGSSNALAAGVFWDEPIIPTGGLTSKLSQSSLAF